MTNTKVDAERDLSFFFKRYNFFLTKSGKNFYYTKDIKTGQYYIKKSSDFGLFVTSILFDFCSDNKINKNDVVEYLKDLLKPRSDASFTSIFVSYITSWGKVDIIESEKFKPVEELIIIENGLKYFNSYICPKYLKKSFNNKNKDENSFPHIKDLIMNLCANDEDSYNYILKVLSHSINNTEDKRQGYLLFQGEPASGKGTFEALILKNIFGKYFVATDSETAFSKFNSLTSDKLWVVIEEKEDVKSKVSNFTASKLKMITGSDTCTKEQKGIDAIDNDNFSNYIITSNEINPGLKLKSNDRRCSILGFSKTLGGSISKSTKKRSLYEKEIPKELDDFVSYLKNLKFDKHDIFKPLINDARSNLINLDMNNVERFIYDKLVIDGLDVDMCKTIEINKIDYIDVNDIFSYFKIWCDNNKMSVNAGRNFFVQFYYITELKAIRKTYLGKKKTVVSVEDMNKFIEQSQEEEEQ